LRRGSQVDFGVCGWAGRSQWAQCRADALGGFLVEPSGQLIAAVAVPEAEVSSGVGGVFRAPTVLIQIAEDSFAERLQLPGIERAGVVTQLGFDLGASLHVEVRGDAGQYRPDHLDVGGADRMLSDRHRGSREFRAYDNICAQVECNWVSNAPNSATNAASLSCHTAAVDITQFYNEALTEFGPNVRPDVEVEKLFRVQGASKTSMKPIAAATVRNR